MPWRLASKGLVAALLAVGLAVSLQSPAMASSTPCTNSGTCPQVGWWGDKNPPTGFDRVNRTIYNDGAAKYDVAWMKSYVEPHPPSQPATHWQVVVDYWNYGTQILYFGCGGVTDPRLDKEWFYRNGKYIGYVPAESTSCSQDPGLVFTLGPGRHMQIQARFHNVPWRGDRIAIEWGTVKPQVHPRGRYINPYDHYIGLT